MSLVFSDHILPSVLQDAVNGSNLFRMNLTGRFVVQQRWMIFYVGGIDLCREKETFRWLT